MTKTKLLTSRAEMNAVSTMLDYARDGEVMCGTNEAAAASRYAVVTDAKSGGATYTPRILADFVASKLVEVLGQFPSDRPLRVLDPGVGDGELLVSLVGQIAERPGLNIEVHGFETDEKALNIAVGRLRQSFPKIELDLKAESFLEFVLEYFGADGNRVSSSFPTARKSLKMLLPIRQTQQTLIRPFATLCVGVSPLEEKARPGVIQLLAREGAWLAM